MNCYCLIVILACLYVIFRHILNKKEYIDTISILNGENSVTKQLVCDFWLENPNISPLSEKYLDKNGKTYKELEKLCIKKKKPYIISILDKLRVVNSIPPFEYDRKYFGDWETTDDGCDTRNKIFNRDSEVPTSYTGRWTNNMENNSKVFYTTEEKVLEIDHTVPLKNAWDSGAWTWKPWQLKAYANDMTNGHLKVYPKSINTEKGSKNAAKWYPTNPIEKCKYFTDWIAIKYRWDLSVTPAEKKYIKHFFNGCGYNMRPSASITTLGSSLRLSETYPTLFLIPLTERSIRVRQHLKKKYQDIDCSNINNLHTMTISDFNKYKRYYGIYNDNSPSNITKYNTPQKICNFFKNDELPSFLF
jgi:hypothetical protein